MLRNREKEDSRCIILYQISQRLIINCGMETDEGYLLAAPSVCIVGWMLMDKFGFYKENCYHIARENIQTVLYGLQIKISIFQINLRKFTKDYQKYIHNIGIKRRNEVYVYWLGIIRNVSVFHGKDRAVWFW